MLLKEGLLEAIDVFGKSYNFFLLNYSLISHLHTNCSLFYFGVGLVIHAWAVKNQYLHGSQRRYKSTS